MLTVNASIDQAAISLGTATLMGASIGFERQWRQRMAGLRTNTLVAIGAASFVIFSGLFRAKTVPRGWPPRLSPGSVSSVRASSFARAFMSPVVGASGADMLFGGSGHDAFVFNAITDSTPASHDTIFNFNHATDQIEFASIAGITAGNGTPTFQGNLTGSGNLTLNAHSVGYREVGGNTEVLVNTTSSAESVTLSDAHAANMEIVLSGTHLGLTSHDFHLV